MGDALAGRQPLRPLDAADRLAAAELVRLDAPKEEMALALAFVAEARPDTRAYDALSPRMRRLVDLIGAVDRAAAIEVPVDGTP